MTDDQSPESVDEQPTVPASADAAAGDAAADAAAGDAAADAAAGEETADAAADDEAVETEGGSRSVEVPMRLYKTVTVFATSIAMVAVILGFVALDVATNRAQAAAEDVDIVVALLGLGSIAFGAAVYAFSTRFTAVGMGKSKDESDEEPDNG